MIIANNIQSSNVLNRQKINNKNTSKTMENLSSGLRINRAGDDAAGLAISQKMRSQIRGLNQASRNIQDGISLIQTADAALGNILDPHLQRMRELSVQAANDVLTSEDRDIIEDEMKQIRDSIDDIANNTEFNTMSLLNRTAYTSSDTVVSVVPGSETPLTTGVRYDTAPSWSGDKIAFSVDAPSVSIVVMDSTGGNEITITDGKAPSFSTDGSKLSYIKGDKIFVSNADGSGEVEVVSSDATHVDDVYQSPPSWSSDDKYLYYISTNGIERVDVASKVSTVIVSDTDLRFPNISPDGTKLVFEKNKEIFISNSDGSNIQKLADGIEPVFSPDGTKIAFGDPTETDVMVMNADGSNIINATGSMTTAALHDHNHHPTWSADGTKIAFHTDMTSGEVGDIWSVSLSGTSSTTVENGGNNLILQVGANAGNQFRIVLTDARSESIGINNINVDSHENASQFITVVDSAIRTVSSERAKFGAYQNALEHIVKNVDNSAENLQAAESRIVDVDMAKEMMTFTKSNILSEAANAMMAQSNQLPQGVLQLLR